MRHIPEPSNVRRHAAPLAAVKSKAFPPPAAPPPIMMITPFRGLAISSVAVPSAPVTTCTMPCAPTTVGWPTIAAAERIRSALPAVGVPAPVTSIVTPVRSTAPETTSGFVASTTRSVAPLAASKPATAVAALHANVAPLATLSDVSDEMPPGTDSVPLAISSLPGPATGSSNVAVPPFASIASVAPS